MQIEISNERGRGEEMKSRDMLLTQTDLLYVLSIHIDIGIFIETKGVLYRKSAGQFL